MENEKELLFEKEYNELLKKHNVRLDVFTWSDEWGDHVTIRFIENGNYCNINYCPEYKVKDEGYRGMGR